MKCSGQQLFTPLYLKLNEAMPWPEQEKAFYLLSSQGLFLCRNTAFFRSCVPVQDFPSELAAQKPFLKLSYPRVPRRLMERVIGFFDVIGERHASEAAVLLAWNRDTNTVEAVIPNQVGLVGMSWSGHPYPLEVEYELPQLPPHLVLIGDIHSHVDGSAYASCTDRSDEIHWPGLHIVVGRILDEPPQFHCEATADGFRFRVHDLSLVLEGYNRRRVKEVPPDWLDKITVKPWSSRHRNDARLNNSYGSGGGTGSSHATGGSSQFAHFAAPEAAPREIKRESDNSRSCVTPPAALPEAPRDETTELSAKLPAVNDHSPIHRPAKGR